MADLKLGRLPKVGLVRMTIGIPEPLKEELDRYAAEHSRLYEPVDAATLIPHMLEAFIRSDRGYRSRRAQSERGKIRRRRGKRNERCNASRFRRFGLKPGNPLLLLAHEEAESLDMLRHVPVG
jgi:hypothetical protein